MDNYIRHTRYQRSKRFETRLGVSILFDEKIVMKKGKFLVQTTTF